MAATSGFLTAISSMLLVVSAFIISSGATNSLPNCNTLDCPKYDVIDGNSDFEIRRYNSTFWTSTSKIEDISFVHANLLAFDQLFDYIQGKNDYGVKIEMTAPVISEVYPSSGPVCASSFVVSFYLPEENQKDPPPAEDLHLQTWGVTYVAVRQFGGFVEDYDIGVQAAKLDATIQNTRWASVVGKGRAGGGKDAASYIVAQYNSPFQFENRVNEIWLSFDMETSAVF